MVSSQMAKIDNLDEKLLTQFQAYTRVVRSQELGILFDWQHEGIFDYHPIQVRDVHDAHHLNHDDHAQLTCEFHVQYQPFLFQSQFLGFEISIPYQSLCIDDKIQRICYQVWHQ